MLDVVFGQASDPGKVRTNNEDALGSFLPKSRRETRALGFLFAVADGVGGLDFGEVASAKAVEVVTKEFAEAQGGSMLAGLLPRLVQHANAAVHDLRLEREYRGKAMATTLVTCALRYDQAVISHVGDSRCYLIRKGKVRQVTEDHTWVAQQRKLGLISKEDISSSDARHVLIRSLGPEMFVSPDTTSISIEPGDVLVLCTDGLHDELPENEMAAIVSQPQKDAEEIVRELVARAVELDGNDNTTAQVIRVRAVEQVGMYRGRPYRLQA